MNRTHVVGERKGLSDRTTTRRDRRPSRRRAQQKRPRSVTRGHYPQGLLQEVQGFHEFTVHPHHRLARLHSAIRVRPGHDRDDSRKLDEKRHRFSRLPRFLDDCRGRPWSWQTRNRGLACASRSTCGSVRWHCRSLANRESPDGASMDLEARRSPDAARLCLRRSDRVPSRPSTAIEVGEC